MKNKLFRISVMDVDGRREEECLGVYSVPEGEDPKKVAGKILGYDISIAYYQAFETSIGEMEQDRHKTLQLINSKFSDLQKRTVVIN